MPIFLILIGEWLLAWALFWCGHVVAKIMRGPSFFGHLYPVYNRLMIWSVNIQGAGRGPWRGPAPPDGENA